MPMHTQPPTLTPSALALAAVLIRPVQQDIVRAQETRPTDNFDAQTQNSTAIDGVGVGVARAEGGYARTGAVEALLGVGLVLVGGVGETVKGFLGWWWCRWFAAAFLLVLLLLCEELARGGGGDEGGGVDAKLGFEGGDWGDC